MSRTTDNPMIVQSDKTILLEVDSPLYEAARDQLARFAELEKSPEYIHTYRMTPLSLWNAAAAGLQADDILAVLDEFSKYPVPDNVRREVLDYISRYGRVQLIRENSHLILVADDAQLLSQLIKHKRVSAYVQEQLDPYRARVDALKRGHIKHDLLLAGYPAEDLAGYTDGAPLHVGLLDSTREDNRPFRLRAYQRAAIDAFWAEGTARGGSGVIVLPCGAGKTVVGIGIMEKLQTATLILTHNTVAARQWISELLDKTDLPADSIGEYSGQRKQIRPVTIATYQIMIYRLRGPDAPQEYPHFALFEEQDWGLIIYDEVHLLPAPVFRITAEIQARRRVGLTATLVREDGRETDVFSLVGPKRYDAPWKELEQQGWIATAICHEVRVLLPDEMRLEYALSDERNKYRVAAENPRKLQVLATLLDKHAEDSVLIIGMYLDQLEQVTEQYGFPMITGKTPVPEREQLYEQFRTGQIKRLIISKVGNFAIDLPDANVAIQISGTFGSRQEEAQRLGRILRPKQDGSMAHFYALVTHDTRDQEYAAKRQRFLTEQGYQYEIVYADELDSWEPDAAMKAYAERRLARTGQQSPGTEGETATRDS